MSESSSRLQAAGDGPRPAGGGLARFVTHRPRLTLALALLLTVAAALLARRLTLETDVVDLLPRRLESATAFARFARAFGSEPTLVVLCTSDDPAALRRFADAYAAALGRSPLVRAVRHRLGADAAELLRRHLAVLLDEEDLAELRRRADPAALEARARRLRALAQGPGGGAAVARLARDPLELLPLLGRRLSAGRSADPATGYFASGDGRALLLFVTPARPSSDLEFDARLEQLALTTAASLLEGRGVRVRLTGAPAYHLAYATMLRGDLTRSTTFSLVAVLVLFALFYRVVRVLPWLAVALSVSTLWTLGAAALMFGRIGAIALAFTAILLGIGIDVPVQLYHRLRHEARERPPREAVAAALADLLRPSVMALLGPAAVFAACALSQFRGLAQLGALTAVGLLLSLLAAVTVFPALLLVLPPGLWLGRPRPPPPPRLLGAWGGLVERRPRALLLVAALVVAGAAPVAAGLRLTPHLLDQRPAGLAPADTERAIDAAFGLRGGARIIALAESDGDLEAVLVAGDRWAGEAERLRAAGRIQAFDTLATLLPSAAAQSRRLAALRDVDPERLARSFGAALEGVGLRAEPFVAGLEPLRRPARIDREALRSSPLAWALALHLRAHEGRLLGATFLHVGPAAPAALEPDLTDAARRVAASGAARVSITGGAVLERGLRTALERDLLLTSGLSMAFTIVLVLGYYRRGRPAGVVLASLGASWVVFAALLRLSGVPLNLFTLLAVPFVLGYGIDDHVFLVHRSAGGAAAALTSTGRAVALTSLTTAAGFAGLLLARHEGLRQLGGAGTLAVGACLLAALALAPVLIRLLRPLRE